MVQDQIADLAAIHGIEPDEVAVVVAWLCGQRTVCVSRPSLPVDGAWSAP